MSEDLSGKKLKNSDIRFVVVAALAAFITYLSMYAFRKPFSAATFDGLSLWGIDYKIVLIISQLVGYTLSKYLGIKIISELDHKTRTKTLLVLMVSALLSLLLFAMVPFPYNFPFMFMNGIPLGLIWGVVFSYIEGRRFTELLGAVMASSFILSSGLVKASGRIAIELFHVGEMWMPFVIGLVFVPLLLLGIYLLHQLPPPDEQDIALRTERIPMNHRQRRKFFLQFAPGIILTVLIYVGLTIFRDMRDNFAVEFWTELGFKNTPQLLIFSEVPIVVLVLTFIALMILIRNNRLVFFSIFGMIFLAGILLLLTTILFISGKMDPMSWMIIAGFAMYLPYLAYNTVFFERWIAHFRIKSNIGFLMYIADAAGYLGSTCVLLFKNFNSKNIGWVDFLKISALSLSVLMVFVSIFAFIYFKNQKNECQQAG
jgi:MFS family permease